LLNDVIHAKGVVKICDIKYKMYNWILI
jgi:hypothetical protein